MTRTKVKGHNRKVGGSAQKLGKVLTYDGNAVFAVPDGFGLYGHDDIDFDATKAEIEHGFKKEYESQIKSALAKVGIAYVGMDYFSPREYNFDTDSLDLRIRVKDKGKFRKAIVENRASIQKNLDKNKSYDGYMATTVRSVDFELERLDKDIKLRLSDSRYEGDEYEPDTIVLAVILNKRVDFSGFDKYDYFVYEPEEENATK